MGQYRSAVITDAGQALLADAISGSGTVTFSAIKTSSYAYPQGTNIAGLTDLQDIVQTVTPFSVQVFNDTMLQVSARFDNSDVASAYLIQTLGAYAQIGDNDPVLFAVVHANTPDQMPVQSSVSPSAFIYNIQITVQQASQITVTVNPAGTATVQDILTLSAQKVDVNGGELSETETSFDDSGSVSEITSFPAFLATFLSKTKTGIFLRNLKAGLQFVLHVGSIVNNCVTDNAELPLSAAQGKVLMDGKAPNNHASSATTYGPGNANQYGHVKVNDAYTSSAGNAAAGVAASSYALAQAYSVLNTKLNLTMYFSDNNDIWVSTQIQNAWARLYKIGYLCVMEGAFTVPAGIAIVNLDLFNISNCGIFPSQQASFSLSSFGGGGGIGYINNDGKVIFAIETPGSSEWRFNFSFISTTL